MKRQSNHKIIISGGGTGGHIYPAVSIANAIKTQDPGADILFVGALGRMEMEKVPAAGYTIKGLPIAGLRRDLSLKSIRENLLLPFRLLDSIAAARKILDQYKPTVAVGVGGYASGPLLWAAGRKGVPYIIQEQNSYAGKTNKLLAPKAVHICVAYPGMEKFFPASKIVLTGNPIRNDILPSTRESHQAACNHFGLDPKKKTILVIGGSLGAGTLNRCMENSCRVQEIFRFKSFGRAEKTAFCKQRRLKTITRRRPFIPWSSYNGWIWLMPQQTWLFRGQVPGASRN